MTWGSLFRSRLSRWRSAVRSICRLCHLLFLSRLQFLVVSSEDALVMAMGVATHRPDLSECGRQASVEAFFWTDPECGQLPIGGPSSLFVAVWAQTLDHPEGTSAQPRRWWLQAGCQEIAPQQEKGVAARSQDKNHHQVRWIPACGLRERT